MLNDSIGELSRASMLKGSKTFSLAASFFGKKEFASAVRIYYWCRHCDDVIDNQAPDESDLEALLVKTFSTVNEPQFLGFQEVCRTYKIPELYPRELLNGMRMDVEGHQYQSLEDLNLYCYRVAGTVGLMMSHVMGLLSESALENAAKLGMAMQLTNICRDVQEDFDRGRVYLPEEWLRDAGLTKVALLSQSNDALLGVINRILGVAEDYYREAEEGIKDLPLRSAFVITVALNLYREIGREIQRRGQSALRKRVVVSPYKKTGLVVKSFFQVLPLVFSRLIRKRTPIEIQRTWGPV